MQRIFYIFITANSLSSGKSFNVLMIAWLTISAVLSGTLSTIYILDFRSANVTKQAEDLHLQSVLPDTTVSPSQCPDSFRL